MSSSLKFYFPRLDLLKFLCCVGVVSIHTQPFLYCGSAIGGIIRFFAEMSVPLFFMVSAFLFWGKITFDFKVDSCILKHFVSRLFILYAAWTVLISPVWFLAFYRKYPEEWLYLLPFKLLVTGAPHGSWFIMSLIQGILLCYILNKYLGKIITTILCFAVTFYVNLVPQGMPDYLNIYYNYKVFNIWFSPLFALLWIQLGLLIRMLFFTKYKLNFMGRTILLGLIASYFFKDVLYLNFIIGVLFKCLVLYFCAIPMEKGQSWDFSMLRKISIVIYFLHFVLVIAYRALVWKGFLSYEYGIREFITILLCTIIGSYIIVKMSEKIKLLKYLY